MLLAGACGKDDHEVSLPTTSAPAAPTAPSVSASSNAETDAVRRSYTRYWVVLAHADRLPPSSRRQELSSIIAEPQLTRVLDRIQQLVANNLTAYGSVVVHIKSVRITGATATLRDCQDSSETGLMNVTTKKKINRGVKEDHVEASLVRGADGRWRVSKVTGLGQGC